MRNMKTRPKERTDDVANLVIYQGTSLNLKRITFKVT